MSQVGLEACGRLQRGLTLVELMIAIVMGLVLLAGVASVFVANKQTYRIQDALARVQENGRFAITFLTRDIRQAGYFGCGTQRTRVKNTLNDPTAFLWSFGNAVEGYDAQGLSWKNQGTSFTTSTLAGVFMAGTTYGLVPQPVEGSDILAVRSMGGCGDRVTEHVQPSADLKLTPKACLQDGDIVMVTDCSDAAIFQVTNVTTQPSVKTNVVHNAGTTKYPPGNATKDLGKKWTGGDIIQVSTNIYYVGETGRGVRALYRIYNGRTPEELVEGVENMQLWFGEGGNADLVVENYLRADEVTNWADVRSVEIHLLVQSADQQAIQQAQTYRFFVNNVASDVTVSDAADRRLRQVFASTVTARNRVR
jgi:type IV pilus assembly protein PilW